MHAVNAKFIMKMWSACQSRRADIANDLSLTYFAAFFEFSRKLVHVRVNRDIFTAMLNIDDIAVALASMPFDDRTVARRTDWGAARRSVINTLM